MLMFIRIRLHTLGPIDRYNGWRCVEVIFGTIFYSFKCEVFTSGWNQREAGCRKVSECDLLGLI
jgi:hypothetical protein